MPLPHSSFVSQLCALGVACVLAGCGAPSDPASAVSDSAAAESSGGDPEVASHASPNIAASDVESPPEAGCPEDLDPPAIDDGCVVDAQGRVTFYRYAAGPEGTYSTLSRVYDGDGNVTEERDDEDGDGVTDYLTTRTFDVAGRATSETISMADGSVYWIQYWEYDAAGNQVRDALDYGGDGEINLETTQRWDGERLMVIERYHRRLDQRTVTTLEWSEDGVVAAVREVDGTLIMRSDYTYDGQNILTRMDSWMDIERMYRCHFEQPCPGPHGFFEGLVAPECRAECDLPRVINVSVGPDL